MAKKFTSNKKSLAEALAEFIEYGLSTKNYNGEIAQVKSVNASLKTCEVETTEGVIIEDVLLEQLQSNNGLFVSPKVGSTVIIDYLDEVSAYVSMFSEIDTIVFQNGDNGGLIKINDLVSNINERETRINAIVTSLSTIATSCNATGTTPLTGTTLGGFITTAIAGIITPLAPTLKSELENENFKH